MSSSMTYHKIKERADSYQKERTKEEIGTRRGALSTIQSNNREFLGLNLMAYKTARETMVKDFRERERFFKRKVVGRTRVSTSFA